MWKYLDTSTNESARSIIAKYSPVQTKQVKMLLDFDSIFVLLVTGRQGGGVPVLLIQRLHLRPGHRILLPLRLRGQGRGRQHRQDPLPAHPGNRKW